VIVGKHVVADFTGCSHNSIHVGSLPVLNNLMREACRLANTTIVSEYCHQFEPYGISILFVLAESHISLHLWEEERFVSIDCYTCGDTTDPSKAIEYLRRAFDPVHAEIRTLNRGPVLTNPTSATQNFN
jgi:S-adenosylmethionine decarboxylase proenzyme